MVLIQFGLLLISYMYLNISILRTSLRLRNEHERNFITIAFLQVSISDLTGTVTIFVVIISLYFLLDFTTLKGNLNILLITSLYPGIRINREMKYLTPFTILLGRVKGWT